jgi:N-formylglutamate amidohydrolase
VAMEKEANQVLEKFGRCFIIDCHSFASKPLPYELNQSSKRPEICIGTDSFHTPESVISTIKAFCKKSKLEVALNEPFSGTYVPLKFYKKDKRVSSVMLEINRSLYMDEKSGLRLKSFDNFQKLLSGLISELIKRISV